jgi:hypothetical protein
MDAAANGTRSNDVNTVSSGLAGLHQLGPNDEERTSYEENYKEKIEPSASQRVKGWQYLTSICQSGM